MRCLALLFLLLPAPALADDQTQRANDIFVMSNTFNDQIDELPDTLTNADARTLYAPTALTLDGCTATMIYRTLQIKDYKGETPIYEAFGETIQFDLTEVDIAPTPDGALYRLHPSAPYQLASVEIRFTPATPVIYSLQDGLAVDATLSDILNAPAEVIPATVMTISYFNWITPQTQPIARLAFAIADYKRDYCTVSG